MSPDSPTEKPAVPNPAESRPVPETSRPEPVATAEPVNEIEPTGEKTVPGGADEVGQIVQSDILRGPNGEIYPTAEELLTLRPVRGKIEWIIYTIAIVEMVERFSYYGTTTIC